MTAAPAGTTWAVGTELNLVNRLKRELTDKKVFFLSSTVCQCATMFRIDAPHLCWAMENLAEGHVVNHIVVPEDEKHWAKVALGPHDGRSVKRLVPPSRLTSVYSSTAQIHR